jgi:hypothetical protein
MIGKDITMRFCPEAWGTVANWEQKKYSDMLDTTKVLYHNEPHAILLLSCL